MNGSSAAISTYLILVCARPPARPPTKNTVTFIRGYASLRALPRHHPEATSSTELAAVLT